MKAQIWSFDFVISVIMFFSVIVLVIFSWNYVNSQAIAQTEFTEIETTALSVSDSLVRIKGIPENWDTSNVRVLGLVSEENIMNETKINIFLTLSNETIKELLGIGNYEFYFAINHLNDTIIEDNGKNITTGVYPYNASIVVPVFRYVLYKGKIKKLEFILWR